LRGQASPADLGSPRRQRCFGGVGGPIREAIVKEFDKNGDGKLNEEERAAARKAMKRAAPTARTGSAHGNADC